MTAYEFLLTRRPVRPDPTNRDELEDKLERDWHLRIFEHLGSHTVVMDWPS